MPIGRRKGDAAFYVLMVSPSVVLYCSIIAGPIIFSLGLSLTNFNFIPNQELNFVWLEQYVKVFQDNKFWIGLQNNLIVVAVSVFGQIPFGLLLAYVLFRGSVRYKAFFQAMVFLPQVISTVVVGILFRNFFGIRGAGTALARVLLRNPDFNFTWFLQRSTAMLPIAVVLLWVYTGYFMLVFLANMQKMDTSILEAASIDGASESTILFKIIIPALSGVILVNSILAIAGSLKGFDMIFALAPNEGQGIGNANLVLPTYMYHFGFRPQKYAFGSAISVVIIAISITFILIANFFGRKLNPERREQ